MGIAEGSEDSARTIIDFLNGTKDNLIICADQYWPSVVMGIDVFRESMINLAKRNIKCKFIIDITAQNLTFCKDLMDIGEIRHLDNLKGNFAANEKEYMASVTIKRLDLLSPIIYSNSTSMVEQQRFLFENLWNKATPAKKRIMEIEYGLIPVETQIIHNKNEIFELVIGITENTKIGLSNCSSFGGFKLIHDNVHFFNAYQNLLARYKKGQVTKGIRWITNIEDKEEQVSLIKKFLDMGVKIKHINNLPPLHFALSEYQLQATIERMKEGKMFANILYSSEKPYISHFQSLFEEMWESGIEAKYRINQIEKGTGSEKTEVIDNAIQIKDLFLSIIKNAKEEILIVFPTVNAVERQQKIRIIEWIRKKSLDNIHVRILSPLNKNVKEIIGLEQHQVLSKNIIVREITKQQNMQSTIIIVDKKHLLAMELKDDSADTFGYAIGQATYSTSKPTILSYVSIFESLWTQTELYKSLQMVKDRLEEQDKMQKEFINLAAHELRTPSQAILGYLELVMIDIDEKDRKKNIDYLKIIMRQAERLSQLTGNILDVARIENRTLTLNKKIFDLAELVRNTIKEFNSGLKIVQKKNLNIIFDENSENNISQYKVLVFADEEKIEQVIVNLLNNAIKFSNDTVEVTVRKDHMNGIVIIRDFGNGIDQEIMPKLFTKFASKSDAGTGLGLFISKSIIDAHGGKIWAYNNNDSKGATFVFSLPLIKEEDEYK